MDTADSSPSPTSVPSPAQEQAPELVYLALGSNLGDRALHLCFAAEALHAPPHTRVVARSAIYETPPLGPPGQGPYFNAVLALTTHLSPLELLHLCFSLERQRGRERRERWGARTLDLDLLLFGTRSQHSPQLTLPHPALLNRAFVLLPLAEVAPQLILAGRPLRQHLDLLDQTGITRLTGPDHWASLRPPTAPPTESAPSPARSP